MSFGLAIKEELCRRPLHLQSPCCLVAEAFGVLLFCNTFAPGQIRIATSSPHFARRLPPLFQSAFGVTFDKSPQDEGDIQEDCRKKYLFYLDNPAKIEKIFLVLGYAPENLSCHINFALVDEDCCLTAFTQGAFLAGGSATYPEKSYHLEFSTCHSAVSRELSALLYEKGFEPKIAQRKGHFLCYYKRHDKIHDFLAHFGAPETAEELVKISTQKMLTGSVNRQVNCDAANLDKAVEAALAQISTIQFLEKAGLLQTLPDKLQETAKLRADNPDSTLSELAELFSPPISKSALNHRLRKIMSLAEEHSSTQKEHNHA